MPPIRLADISTDMSDTHRCYEYLLHIWRFVPGIQDEIIHPDNPEKKAFYDEFVSVCDNDMMKAAFNGGMKLYKYPWTQLRDDLGGRYWAIALARAALEIRFALIDVTKLGCEPAFQLVLKDVVEQVFKKSESRSDIEEDLREAQRQNDKYKAVFKKMKEYGPQRLPEPPKKQELDRTKGLVGTSVPSNSRDPIV